MTNLAGAGPFRALPDVMGERIPVVRKRVVMFHFDSRALEGVPYCRNDAQWSDKRLVPWTPSEDESGLGSSSFSKVALITVTIWT